MRREEQPVFVSSRRVLRFDDVEQSRDWHFDVVDDEQSSVSPDGLELGHHKREVDVEIPEIRRVRDEAPLDDALSEQAVTRDVQRLVARPQAEPRRLERVPTSEQVVGIERQEEIAISRA